MLKVCESFISIQGESTFAGLPCAFVRLSGCNLRCTYCDTPYARDEGDERNVDELADEIAESGVGLVEVTGGEPLLQQDTPRLCSRLLERGLTVLVETNGTRDISVLPDTVVRIMDIKTPGSGQQEQFLEDNLDYLRPTDECKLVICNRTDFDWARDLVRSHDLAARCTVILSPASGELSPDRLAEWILAERLPVRLGLQLHKVIWGDERGR
ncbi:MAG: radical SAM protein [Chitinivibrionales bacterium]|nr:radical SAM protein [Chitinivibrionales bacterium]